MGDKKYFAVKAMTLSDTLYATSLRPEGTRVVITPATIDRLRPRKKIVPELPQISAISKNSVVETTGPGNCSAKHVDGDREILSGKTIYFSGERNESSMEKGEFSWKKEPITVLK